MRVLASLGHTTQTVFTVTPIISLAIGSRSINLKELSSRLHRVLPRQGARKSQFTYTCAFPNFLSPHQQSHTRFLLLSPHSFLSTTLFHNTPRITAFVNMSIIRTLALAAIAGTCLAFRSP
jgi:hypothetical protein